MSGVALGPLEAQGLLRWLHYVGTVPDSTFIYHLYSTITVHGIFYNVKTDLCPTELTI